MGMLAVRMGDTNDGGGAIITTLQSTVLINGQLASVVGSAITPHVSCPIPPTHCVATVVTGSSTVFISGIPAVRVNDNDSCSHKRVTGSSNVFIG